jgi:3D (Asp-Asp-Asp) domain-containing protein
MVLLKPLSLHPEYPCIRACFICGDVGLTITGSPVKTNNHRYSLIATDIKLIPENIAVHIRNKSLAYALCFFK